MTDLIGIDPGLTTGWVRYRDSTLVEAGETEFSDIFKWLSSQHPQIWVVENYRIRPPNQTKGKFVHAWDKGETLRIIGAIELLVEQDHAELVTQEPVEKVQGYKLMGKEYKKGKRGMHIFDANAHVHVYFAKQQRVSKK